ncbi:MAG: DNA-binding response regulator [Verrucomicrobia bacterium]|nr:MAG: DNA-binding response regulator [Verrucomicrobiota bacterium]
MKKLRILIADDHGLVRRGARAVLHARRDWRVVGDAANGRETIQKAIKLKPNVVILDVSMPELDGVEVARQIRESLPDTKILVLTMHESDQMVQCALHAGAHGYILKSDLTDSLPKAVRAVAEGKRFLTPKVSEIVLDGFLKTRSEHQQQGRRSTRTTPREIEIIRLLAEGKSNKEIAARLGITVRTVETHRSKIMLKLDLHSLAELIHYAMRLGIVTLPGDPGMRNKPDDKS